MKKLLLLTAIILIGQHTYACTASFTSTVTYSNVTFHNTSTGPTGRSILDSSIWYFGDGTTSNAYMPSHAYTATGTYTVSLVEKWYDTTTASYVCTDSTYHTVTISALGSSITGTIFGDTTSPLGIDTFKVWLITFDSSTFIITAVDSQLVTGHASADYDLAPVMNGNYLIKAKQLTAPSSGYSVVPSYYGFSSSTIYWGAATYVHVVSTSGIIAYKSITLQHGTATSGPGFVAGNVLYGAGKMTHTTGTVGDPVVGLLIFVRDASGNLVASTYTDASGDYSFSNLPLGNYSIYPEDMGFATTPFNFSITSSATSVSNANFKQNSNSIYPAPAAVPNVAGSIHQLSIYPNPGNGMVNISLKDNQNINTAQISINNITGQQVYNANISFNTSGYSQLDLSGLQSGIYFVNVVTNSNQYTQKLVIQH